MATLVLSTVGKIAGNALGGTIGGYLGSTLGLIAGAAIDNRIFGTKSSADNMHIVTATYGAMIPIVYGRMRVEGQIIWTAPIRLVSAKPSSIFGGTATQEHYATFAMALCEGQISKVNKIWSDGILIDRNQMQYTIYPGSDTQLPDPLILSLESKAPAYRGLAYVVIENLPLSAFGNRIPNLSFEVERSVRSAHDVCKKITAVNLLPASGEFVYDTVIQSKIRGQFYADSWIPLGHQYPMNNNSESNLSDAIVSLEQLQDDMPNVQWISLTFSWFASELNIGNCVIYPAVEYNNDSFTAPDNWQVGEITRQNAREISRDHNGRPRFGGTPSDSSIIRYATELRRRGYKVMAYPLLMVDLEGKPWRGTMSGRPADIEGFFAQYNKFIMHYAHLLKDYVDGLIIGSEMEGVTRIGNGTIHPGITKFAELANNAKSILGNEKTVTYAANWSEYHSAGGLYNMDELWTAPGIDVVGIDAYFPLTDSPQPPNGFSRDEIKKGWHSGEYWDYYYDERGELQDITERKYSIKDMETWWANEHINPDGSKTAWQPKMKKIWFTEFGFPSLDSCSNQPNLFYDPMSTSGGIPKHSSGAIDFNAQLLAIDATLEQWQNSEMVTKMFLWAWDARPYPYFPDRADLWADGSLWAFGHWVNGKINNCSLAAMIQDVANRGGIPVDISKVYGHVRGHIISYQQDAVAALDIIRTCYNLRAFESAEGKVVFLPSITPSVTAEIPFDDVIAGRHSQHSFFLLESNQQDYPKTLKINFINRLNDYNVDSITVFNSTAGTEKTLELSLPMASSRDNMETYANVLLRSLWVQRRSFRLSLPMKYLALEPFDSIVVGHETMVISNVRVDSHITIEATSDDPLAYSRLTNNNIAADYFGNAQISKAPKITKTDFAIFELPAITDQPIILISPLVSLDNWPGAMLYVSYDNRENFQQLSQISSGATHGIALDCQGGASPYLIDKKNAITINVSNGTLESTNEAGLRNGKNIAIIGQEIIQFRYAELVAENQYKITHLIRGKYNTHNAPHIPGERFVLLDINNGIINYKTKDIGINIDLKLTTIGMPSASGVTMSHMIKGMFFQTMAPVHVKVVRDGNDILISWTRCTRTEGVWHHGMDLDEPKEMYDIEIVNKQGSLIQLAHIYDQTECRFERNPLVIMAGMLEVTIAIYQLSITAIRGYPAIIKKVL